MPSTCSFFRAGACVRETAACKVLVPWAKLVSTKGRWIQTADKAQSKYAWAWTANWQWLCKGMAPGRLLPRWLLNWSLYLFMRFATVMNIYQPGFSITFAYRLWLLHRKRLPDPLWRLCWFAALCGVAQHSMTGVCFSSLWLLCGQTKNHMWL